MIVITGAYGFIGSCLVAKLNEEKFFDLVLVDDFKKEQKKINLADKKYSLKVDREKFFNWLNNNHKQVEFIFHIGARTDTTEFNMSVFDELNIGYSQKVWEHCSMFGIPMVYASSAATYGDGGLGYSDNHSLIPKLEPLNPYGVSKNLFDIWALEQTEKPYFWTGLKFFNVYGPNEYHKGRMASVVFHAYNQIIETGKMKLFRSHRPDFKDGEQKRDFVYVKDVTEVLFWLMNNRNGKNNGIYNLGSGKAATFNTLAYAIFSSLNNETCIEYIDTPEDIRDKYQYFTEAEMTKLKSIGYTKPFTEIETGVRDYITNYLSGGKCY